MLFAIDALRPSGCRIGNAVAHESKSCPRTMPAPTAIARRPRCWHGKEMLGARSILSFSDPMISCGSRKPYPAFLFPQKLPRELAGDHFENDDGPAIVDDFIQGASMRSMIYETGTLTEWTWTYASTVFHIEWVTESLDELLAKVDLSQEQSPIIEIDKSLAEMILKRILCGRLAYVDHDERIEKWALDYSNEFFGNPGKGHCRFFTNSEWSIPADKDWRLMDLTNGPASQVGSMLDTGVISMSETIFKGVWMEDNI